VQEYFDVFAVNETLNATKIKGVMENQTKNTTNGNFYMIVIRDVWKDF